ncbi:hypothetical protein P152DRAFT_450799 [Eremomyces bilateralis CBS 781.70]|uniref:DUF6594 domain-containing protein n=1 Tax=Eremomyces bilateralis CBS 781.70 TaxID=1392243 RepID=A0A6G1FY89_9PEZI|nr:uncharacterized protein P152DRAFT_450799 [Eremomyces bilateralis CBS 781.70]KAF1810807.1 hypothetical protein P152DRAFT_450799 [Eremomyces bilateralis CBS 781.70]
MAEQISSSFPSILEPNGSSLKDPSNLARPQHSRKRASYPGYGDQRDNPQWINAEEERPSRRRASHPGYSSRPSRSRRTTRDTSPIESSGSSHQSTRLNRILEADESDPEGSRSSSRRRQADEWRSTHRKPVRSRVAVQRKVPVLTSQSLLSVISTLTNTSNTSSGSNSTVTQKSYNKTVSSRRRRDGEHAMESGRSSSTLNEGQLAAIQQGKELHVFEFLQQVSPEPGSPTSVDGSQSAEKEQGIGEQHHVPYFSADQMPSQELMRYMYKPGPPDLSHSDSGISIRGSSPEPNDESQSQPDNSEKKPRSASHSQTLTRRSSIRSTTSSRPADPSEDSLRRNLETRERDALQHLQSPQPQRTFRPPTTGTPYPPPMPLYPHEPPYAPPHAHPYAHYPHMPYPPMTPIYPSIAHQLQLPNPPIANPEPPFDPSTTTVTGYELLAAKLTVASRRVESAYPTGDDEQPADAGLTPVYRKFEALNHRILLHIQDELSELEEELRILDEHCAQLSARSEKEGVKLPSSRRMEGSSHIDLYRRRTLLLGRVFEKLNQYNQALASYNKTRDRFQPAEEADVSAYKAWMDKEAAVEKSEVQFLEHLEDLVSLRSRHRRTAPSPVAVLVFGLVFLVMVMFLAVLSR